METKKTMNYLFTLTVQINYKYVVVENDNSVQLLLKHLTQNWYHIAVTHDDSDNEIDIYIDNKRVVTDNGFPEFTAAVSNADLIIGKGDDE